MTGPVLVFSNKRRRPRRKRSQEEPTLTPYARALAMKLQQMEVTCGTRKVQNIEGLIDYILGQATGTRPELFHRRYI